MSILQYRKAPMSPFISLEVILGEQLLLLYSTVQINVVVVVVVVKSDSVGDPQK